MARLSQNSTPCERKRYASFADDFASQANVEANGGTIVGAPVFDVKNGVTLDGAADYLSYHLCGSEFNSDPLSVIVEFTPDFATNENAIRRLFDTLAGNRYSVVKNNNAGNNVLTIYLGNTFIASIPEATYSPHWLVGQRNVLVVSGTTGDADAWLNGTQILTNDASVWTPTPPVTLFVGTSNAGVNLFDGTIHGLKVFKAKLSAQEALDYSDQTIYSYRNNATAIWQMRMQDHDPANNRTLDASGNGHHMTDVHDPVKLVHHGYNFDGANDLFTRPDDGVFDPAGSFSVQCVIEPSALPGADKIIFGKGSPFHNTDGYILYHNSDSLYFILSDTGRVDLGQFTLLIKASSLVVGKTHYATLTYRYIGAGTSEMNLYLDDLAVVGNTNARGPIFNSPLPLEISSGADGMAGDINQVAYYDGLVLTGMQHIDFMIRAQKQRNMI